MVREDCSESFALFIGLTLLLIMSFVFNTAVRVICTSDGKDFVQITVNNNEYLLNESEQDTVADFIQYIQSDK